MSGPKPAADTTRASAPPSAPNASSRAASPLSPIADGFILAGVSNPPDPATHAFRQDLADTALAGRVIASHYAEPLSRALTKDADLFASPDAEESLARLNAGDCFRMLDCSRGWAWGYAPDGRVGYVESGAF